MPDDRADEIIRRYLQDAIAAQTSFESQLRGFSQEGDDDEVQSAFANDALQKKLQGERLFTRLEELGGSRSAGKSLLAHLGGLSPRAAQFAYTPDERLAQNLVMAYSIETSACAMLEALAAVARAAKDARTETLARELQAEARQTAETFWGFIPSRSKIAFNMLTAGEMDPAVETRMADDRLI